MPYLVLPILIGFALIPSINFFVTRPENDIWFFIVLLMGYFAFFLLFIRTEWFVKVIALGSFSLCFVCASPLTAFTSYFSILLCCYLYVFCTRIKNWSIIFKSLQTLLFLNTLLIGMQALGKDSLLNFGLGKSISSYGIIGQHMQMGSFSIVLSAILLSFSKWNLIFPLVISFFCNSSWTLLTLGIGIYFLLNFYSEKWAAVFFFAALGFSIVYAFATGKIDANFGPDNGRWNIWMQSLKWANYHPWVGWGAGSYKLLFPSFYLTRLHDIPYKTAHNWLVQLIFEMGYPFTLFLLTLVINLGYRLWKAKEILCFVGLVMIFVDMEVHFPDRMLQTVGIIICFLAYCRTKLNHSRGVKY